MTKLMVGYLLVDFSSTTVGVVDINREQGQASGEMGRGWLMLVTLALTGLRGIERLVSKLLKCSDGGEGGPGYMG